MLCVIVKVNSAARERLMKLEEIPERFGFPPRNLHGHITLATYIGDDEKEFISSCKAILSNYGKFPVYYDKVEAWISTFGARSLIVAVPRKEPTIVSIQREISRQWSAYLNEWTQEDVWNPHTSLLYVSRTDLTAVAEAMQEEFEPFAAEIDQIEFSRVQEIEGKFTYETVDFVELQ